MSDLFEFVLRSEREVCGGEFRPKSNSTDLIDYENDSRT